MKLQDLAGSLKVDPLQAAQLIRSWFHPQDIVVLSGKKVIRSGDFNVMSQSITASELVGALLSDSGEETLALMCNDPVPLDMYVNVGTPRDPLKSMTSRVREADLDHVIGVIGDFDVKESGFKDTAQIIRYLDSLDLRPTIIVESGSGGVHAWWKFNIDPAMGSVDVKFGKDISARWWTYLNKIAQRDYSATVDKLVDTARMLRLPGTIHWPRYGSSEGASPVRLVTSDGPSHTPVEMMNVAAEAWGERNIKVRDTRDRDRSVQLNTNEYAKLLGGSKWGQRLAVAGVEDYFQEKVSWEGVLSPAGWTYVRTDSSGREEWARPGRSGEKSACVNWEGSPHVMSLLSTSHDTGLLDLLDADIPLTKWRVSLRLNFNDDYQQMVDWTMALMSAG